MTKYIVALLIIGVPTAALVLAASALAQTRTQVSAKLEVRCMSDGTMDFRPVAKP